MHSTETKSEVKNFFQVGYDCGQNVDWQIVKETSQIIVKFVKIGIDTCEYSKQDCFCHVDLPPSIKFEGKWCLLNISTKQKYVNSSVEFTIS